ncbi:hypothetical protein [Kribbia dieselivorans]|uniref:hypothetical protein n=1 Tax=Kribbia dieselivorans TaxID=331526 RepID=UPI000838616B|nr:hypothetical protein [Kribbia dieselivorans]
MSLAFTIRVLLRRWYVVLIGMLAVVLVLAGIRDSSGVYFAQVNVVFMPPVEADVPNGLRNPSESLIATAGIIQREVSGGKAHSQVVSESVTIAAEGVRTGERVRLPNTGGQWANHFDKAVLDVQAVDVTEVGARRRLDALVDDIVATLNRRQQRAGIDPTIWVRTRLSPTDPAVVHLEPHRTQAMAMTVLLGGGLTVGAAAGLDEWLDRRRTRVR